MSDINHLGPRYPPNRLSRANLLIIRTKMRITRTCLLDGVQTVPKRCTRGRKGAADGSAGLDGGMGRGGEPSHARLPIGLFYSLTLLSPGAGYERLASPAGRGDLGRRSMTVGGIVTLPLQALPEVRRSPTSARCQAHVRSEVSSAWPGNRAGSCRNGAERHGRNRSNH